MLLCIHALISDKLYILGSQTVVANFSSSNFRSRPCPQHSAIISIWLHEVSWKYWPFLAQVRSQMWVIDRNQWCSCVWLSYIAQVTGKYRGVGRKKTEKCTVYIYMDHFSQVNILFSTEDAEHIKYVYAINYLIWRISHFNIQMLSY